MVDRYKTDARMSAAVVHEGTIYLAGQVPDGSAADIATQISQVLAKIERLLELAGSDKPRLLSATIWLSDMRYFADMNAVWDAWVPSGQAPARACIGTPLADPDFEIEIGIIAVAKQGAIVGIDTHNGVQRRIRLGDARSRRSSARSQHGPGARQAAFDRVGRVGVAQRRGVAGRDKLVDQRLVLRRERVVEGGQVRIPLLHGARAGDG
jgi:enamine deaminase RidA (YjgF/YER057c/UK114 family)